MTKKTTLILFYSGVAAICVGILAVVNLLIVPRIEAKKVEAGELFTNVGQTEEETWFDISKDLKGTIQTGEEVRLSDLRGKVWVIAQFFAVCPHCAVRNGAELKRIYEEFKDHPDFQMVCVSVDPEQDDVEKLANYAEALGAGEGWWFMNAGDQEKTHEYLEETLGFMGIRERTDPVDIEANGRYRHDMGLLLVNRDFQVIGKWPMTDERDEEMKALNPDLFQQRQAELREAIRAELNKGETS